MADLNLILRNGFQVGAPIVAPHHVGEVFLFAASSAPSGALKANGALISRTTYAALFAALGTMFGAGDGSTTFQLPDCRGEFFRGWDDSRGIDSGRALGSWQGDLLRNHTHNTAASAYGGKLGSGSYAYAPFYGSAAQNDYPTGNPLGGYAGAETRPRNVALLACIQYA